MIALDENYVGVKRQFWMNNRVFFVRDGTFQFMRSYSPNNIDGIFPYIYIFYLFTNIIFEYIFH